MKSLVLSGGASKGGYQAGALKYLMGELKIKYDIVCGISVGAINAAHISAYPHGEEEQCAQDLIKLWTELEQEDVYVSWKPFGRLHFFWTGSLYDSRPLIKLIKEEIDINAIKNNKKKLRIGAVNLNTAEYKTFDENYEDLTNAVLASSSFPLAFLPINLEGSKWTDGGVRQIIPLRSAIQAGATEIHVISTSPEKLPKSDNLSGLSLGYRVLDIMSSEITEDDLRYPCDNIKIIRPDEEITDDSLDFSQENIQNMIAKGYEDAKKLVI